MLQKARLSFLFVAIAALLAPNFVGEVKTRLRFVGAWIGFMVIFHWLVTAINTPSTLENVAPPFLGGFTLTLSIAYYVMLASFPIGILMALARTSDLPIFRMLSTVYIEFVRGVPLISLLLFSQLMLPLFLPRNMERPASLTLAIFVIMFFSAAYIAEIVRGGLQAVPKGQTEAAQASGMSAFNVQRLIVLPQALRASIPAMVGQFIALFKDTSLLFFIGIAEFLEVAQIANAQNEFVGASLAPLTYAFVAVGFWAFAYTLSKESRRLETKLGVGTR